MYASLIPQRSPARSALVGALSLYPSCTRLSRESLGWVGNPNDADALVSHYHKGNNPRDRAELDWLWYSPMIPHLFYADSGLIDWSLFFRN